MMRWFGWSRRVQVWREEAREHIGDGIDWRLVAIALGTVVVVFLALSFYWSREPEQFSVPASVEGVLHRPIAEPVVGAVTTATLVQIVTTLLDKPGGFINNDIAPPGVWLDNMASWERGALQQSRDMTRILRDDFGRAAVTAAPDEDLAYAEPRLHFSANSWMLPSTESQYRDARNYLQAYLLRLQNAGAPTAYFVATPANLERYLTQVTLRLDALTQRLSACVAPKENPLQPPSVLHPRSVVQASTADFQQRATTPTFQIDDVFYEARGSAWALLHLMRAIDNDFAVVLREKNAQNALHEMIRDLDATQATIYSPVILNGSGFGLLANHSLVMASYIARADAAAASVIRSLAESATDKTAIDRSATDKKSATDKQEPR